MFLFSKNTNLKKKEFFLVVGGGRGGGEMGARGSDFFFTKNPF